MPGDAIKTCDVTRVRGHNGRGARDRRNVVQRHNGRLTLVEDDRSATISSPSSLDERGIDGLDDCASP
jgi:hypothetical protein